ncbi:MAG: nucleotidyltransferase family protein [Candidatus Aquicultorales bacterium]
MILAGGLGTRLRPAVENLPKSMAPVAGKPFLEHQLIRLKTFGYTEVVLLVGHMSELISDRFEDGSSLGMDISYSKEETPLGTGGAVRNALHLLKKTFLLLNGDTFFDVDYNELADLHRERRAVLTIALAHAEEAARYGLVRVGEDGRVLAFDDKAANGPGLINGGVYVMERSAIERVPEGQRISLEKEVIPEVIKSGLPVYGRIFKGAFIDIGTPEAYEMAQHFLAGGSDVYKK